MKKVSKILRIIARVWIYFAFTLIIIGSLSILFFHGIWRFWEIMNPFNFGNTIIIVITLLPALLLNKVAKKFEKTVEYGAEAAKKFYLIGENDNQLIGWKNNHDFDDVGAPWQNEIFLNIFSESWIAVQYLHSVLKNKTAGLYVINSEDSWNYYKGLAIEALGAERAIINLCDFSKRHTNSNFVIYPLDSNTNDFNDIQKTITEIKSCSVCYNREKFLKNQNFEGKIKVFSMDFS